MPAAPVRVSSSAAAAAAAAAGGVGIAVAPAVPVGGEGSRAARQPRGHVSSAAGGFRSRTSTPRGAAAAVNPEFGPASPDLVVPSDLDRGELHTPTPSQPSGRCAVAECKMIGVILVPAPT